jgi:hypothetical protein
MIAQNFGFEKRPGFPVLNALVISIPYIKSLQMDGWIVSGE